MSKSVGHSLPTCLVTQATAFLNPDALGLNGELISPLGTIIGPQVFAVGYTSFMLTMSYQGDIAGALFGIQLVVQPRDILLAPAGPAFAVATSAPTFALATTAFTFGYAVAGSQAIGWTAFDFQLQNLDDAVAYTVTCRLYLTGRI